MSFNLQHGTVIAIDPDIKKSGLAVIDRESRSCEVFSLTFPEIIDKVRGLYGQDVTKSCYKVAHRAALPFRVIVEAGWMNKGNWHVTESRNGKFSPSAYAAAIGKGEGECHAVSKKLLECFEYYDIPCTPAKPLLKCWHGPDRKITHEELVREMRLYKIYFPYKRTNQETRDAALLALVNL